MESVYVPAKDVKTIQEILYGMDAEFSQLRIAMESQQADVRRILLGREEDTDSTNAKTGLEGCP